MLLLLLCCCFCAGAGAGVGGCGRSGGAGDGGGMTIGNAMVLAYDGWDNLARIKVGAVAIANCIGNFLILSYSDYQ